MEAIEKSKSAVIIRISRMELMVLNNALNEVLHGPEAIQGSEFQTRIGLERRDAERLLKEITDTLGHDGTIA